MARWRRSLNEWSRGPATPSHSVNDLEHFTSYVQRRAVVVVFVGFGIVVGLASLVSYSLSGTVYRAAVAPPATLYWFPAWQFYLRHHYRPEFQKDADVGE